jgi:hypothetical protein
VKQNEGDQGRHHADRHEKDLSKPDTHREAKPEQHKENAAKPGNAKRDNKSNKNPQLVNSPPPVGPGHCVPAPGYPCPSGGAPTGSASPPPSSAGSNLPNNPGLPNTPDLARFLDAALPCPQGFTKTGETFYGGTKCSPAGGADVGQPNQGPQHVAAPAGAPSPHSPSPTPSSGPTSEQGPSSAQPSTQAPTSPEPMSDLKLAAAMVNKILEDEVGKDLERTRDHFWRRQEEKEQLQQDLDDFGSHRIPRESAQ